MVNETNLQVYDDPPVVERHALDDGWKTRGEQAALMTVAPLVRSRAILDLGVGTGRTVSLMALLSDAYVGVDYSPRRVAACRARYPGADVRVGDARDLRDFADCSFGLVLFSFNGIDTMDHAGRSTAMREVHRVLEPDGFFVFSTLNRDGPSWDESPWQLHQRGRPWDRSAKAAAYLVWRNAEHPARLLRRPQNWLRTRRQWVDADGWGIRAVSGADFRIVNHFVTLDHLRQEVAAAGFELLAVYRSDAAPDAPIPPRTRTSDTGSFHVVARKQAPVA